MVNPFPTPHLPKSQEILQLQNMNDISHRTDFYLVKMWTRKMYSYFWMLIVLFNSFSFKKHIAYVVMDLQTHLDPAGSLE